MHLSHVIIGQVVTEKAERQKTRKTYTIAVANDATKIDVTNALEKYYGVEVQSIRVMRTASKSRAVGRGKVMVKRHSIKRAMITLTPKSKTLDLASFIA